MKLFFCSIFFLTFPLFVFGNSNEDFDSYIIGGLSSQSDWASTGNDCIVSSDYRDSGFDPPVAANYLRVSFADYAGLDHDPYLVIEYSIDVPAEEATSTVYAMTSTSYIALFFGGFLLFLFTFKLLS